MFESLHNHTIASDGVLSREQLLRAAEKYGIGVMALTDHDAVPSASELDKLRSYSGPTKWLIGVELSSWVTKAAGGADKGAVHVLGLFVNPGYAPLVDFCEAAEESRIRRMKVYVDHLTGLGFDVTEGDIKQAATSRNIGKPHMVKAVMSKPANRGIVESMRERMRQASENDEALKARYDQMIAEGPKQYPYVLFMGSDAFIPAPKSDIGGLLDFEDTVKLIRDAGGVAAMAHWYLDKAKFPASELEAVISAGGMDGLETEIVNVISDHSAYAKDVQYLRGLAKQHHLFEEVSADGHSLADLEAFAGDPVAQRSIGQTDRIIRQVKPNMTWSNY